MLEGSELKAFNQYVSMLVMHEVSSSSSLTDFSPRWQEIRDLVTLLINGQFLHAPPAKSMILIHFPSINIMLTI